MAATYTTWAWTVLVLSKYHQLHVAVADWEQRTDGNQSYRNSALSLRGIGSRSGVKVRLFLTVTQHELTIFL